MIVYLAKDDVLSVEPGRWHQSEEELASIGIGSYTDKIKGNQLEVQIQISIEICMYQSWPCSKILQNHV